MRSRAVTLVGLCVGLSLSVARADIITSTPTFPPVGGVYAGLGAGCFPLAGICTKPGALVIGSVISNTFDASGQDFTANARFSVPLTNLLGAPIGTLRLTGTIGAGVDGRTSATATGSWTTEVDSLDLGGTLFGFPLDVGLDTSNQSGGTLSITPVGDEFRIHSFFDVFVDLDFGTVPPLHASRGPLPVSLVPEPGTLALFGVGLVALGLWRRRPSVSQRG